MFVSGVDYIFKANAQMLQKGDQIYSWLMSRPLRIEYPDAWYHVMNRGRQGDPIFRKEDDYLTFIALLK